MTAASAGGKGSTLRANLYRQWQEIGLIQELKIYDPEVFLRFEGKDGKVIKIYSDVNKLEKHLLEQAPEDAPAIKEMCRDIRRFSHFELPPIDRVGGFFRFLGALPKTLPAFLRAGTLVKMTTCEYAARFKNDF